MFEVLNLRREIRYGLPAADQILFNRHYVLGYSYYFRQAKWTLEVIDSDYSEIDRSDTYRPDYRIPELFRADLIDYSHSGYDRGHLVASSNQKETVLQNSETFLLSNMSPQYPNFNRGIWKELEIQVRKLNEQSEILETYVMNGPIFYFDQPVEIIGAKDENEVTIPIPHAYFKSILTENERGRLSMWSFVVPNKESKYSLRKYSVSTASVEKLAGIKVWEKLVGKKIATQKSKINKAWFN